MGLIKLQNTFIYFYYPKNRKQQINCYNNTQAQVTNAVDKQKNILIQNFIKTNTAASQCPKRRAVNTAMAIQYSKKKKKHERLICAGSLRHLPSSWY